MHFLPVYCIAAAVGVGASPWGTRGAAYGPLVGWLVPVVASGVFWYVNELAVARRLGGKVATLRALLDVQAMCGTGAWCVGGRQCCLRVPRCVNTIGVGEGEGTRHPQGPHYVTRCARTYLFVAMHLHSSIASANASDVVKNNNARLIQPFLLAHCTILQQVYSLLSRLSDSFAHYAIMHRTLA